MYFGSFQQLSLVNTGFPPSKVPIRRKLGLDADVDRSDEAAVKKAIEAKYGVEVSGFEDLVRFSA
jgi:hypothetical protein